MGGSRAQTVSNDPWSGQQPYLQDTFQQAQNLYDQGPAGYFPGATYVPFSQQTQQGLGLQEQRALGGSPVTDNAQNFAAGALGQAQPFGGGLNYLSGGPTLDHANQQFQGSLTGVPDATTNALQQTAQGNSLQGNPYLDQTFDQAASRITDTFNQQIAPGINATFSDAGRVGSDAHADVLTRNAGNVSDSLAQLSNQIYGGNYQQERDRQLQAAGQLGSLSQNQQGLGLQAAGQGANFFNQLQGNQLQAGGLDLGAFGQQIGLAGLAPALANVDYSDIGQLLGVGGRVEGQAGNVLQDLIGRYDHSVNAPGQSLDDYIARIQGQYGGTQTTSGGGPSSTQQLAGLLATGLGFAFGGPAGGAAAGTAVNYANG